MSVKGFDFDGTVHRYDYNSLESIPLNLASKYSESRTYRIGDYCIYEEKLYKCVATIATPKAWDAGDWTSAMIASEYGTWKLYRDGNGDLGELD